MLENRNDLLENKKAEIASIIERTNSLLGEKDISLKDVMQHFLESGGNFDYTSTTRAISNAHVSYGFFKQLQ